MTDLLKDIFNKLWGKYISLLIFLALCILGIIGLISEDWSKLQPKDYIIIGTITAVYIAYAIYVWIENRLPHAKVVNRSILFVIFAESPQLFDDVKKKLIQEFCDCMNNDGVTVFEAKYINAEQIKKYNLDKKTDVIELLAKTNCAFIVRAKYLVDSVTSAENYAMHINCGVVHPELTDKAQYILQHDMSVLANPISKRKFKKNNVIDELEFTAHQLSIMCTYTIGLVEIFSGQLEDAYTLFKKLYAMQKDSKNESILDGIKSWLFICCIDNSRKYLTLFQSDKHIPDLEKSNVFLEEANALHPATYDYYLNKAYYHIAAQRDIASATRCIAECKKIHSSQSWKYSDAFLAAFKECAASSIISKYRQAFKVDVELLPIVDYIEYIIEADKTRIGLHLAAALIYSQLSDTKLQAEHIAYYFENESSLKNKETVKRHFAKGKK